MTADEILSDLLKKLMFQGDTGTRKKCYHLKVTENLSLHINYRLSQVYDHLF